MQTAASALVIEIGGTLAGWQYDELKVTGNATLNGMLNVSNLGGYVPELGVHFTPVVAAAVTGVFDSYSGLSISSQVALEPNYPDNPPTDVLLTAVQYPLAPWTPVLSVNGGGGTYDGSPLPITVTVTGQSGTPTTSLEGVTPTVIYYAGNQAGGTPLGRAAEQRRHVYGGGLVRRQRGLHGRLGHAAGVRDHFRHTDGDSERRRRAVRRFALRSHGTCRRGGLGRGLDPVQ